MDKRGGLGCGKKTRYGSKSHADSVIRLRNADPVNPPTTPLWSYECPVCGGWHLSKLKPPDAQEAAA